MNRWITAARMVPIIQVAAGIGMQVRKKHLPCCPACGCIGNGSGRIKRGNDLVWRWKCFRCDAGGDGVDLVSYHLTGSAMGKGAPSSIRGWFSGRGWAQAGSVVPFIEPPTVLRRPPPGELHDILRGASRPLQAGRADVLDWMRGRGLDPATAPCGVLPQGARWPGWWPASFAKRWPVVVTAVDPAGEILSLHGRAVDPEVEADRKTTWPFGRDSGGLLFADPWVARPMLRRRGGKPSTVLVAEGITDYLAAAQRVHEFGGDLGVLGITSGSCRALEQVSWPDGVRILAATDPDAHGEKYLHRIVRAVYPLPVRRLMEAGHAAK